MTARGTSASPRNDMNMNRTSQKLTTASSTISEKKIPARLHYQHKTPESAGDTEFST